MRKTYTREEKNALAVRAQQGDVRARRELVPAMIGLVVMFAIKGRAWSGGLADIEDMKAQGWIAVFECVEKFDANHPQADFGGMCSYLIPERVGLAAREAGVVRLGRGKHAKAASYRLRRIVSEYEGKGLSPQAALREASKQVNISEAEAAHIMRSARTYSVGTGEGEHDPADDAPHVVDVINEADTTRVIGELLGILDERARSIVQGRANGVSLDDIGAGLGLSRERCRRIWGEAIEALQREAKLRKLSLSDLL